MQKIPVLAVVGPTASGKTALAVALAKRYGAEIISADSMQIYRGMDIATAKPGPEERQGVPHHLMDFLDPGEAYSAAAFCADAEKAILDIVSRGRRAIVCGGTGLYVDSLLSGLRFFDEPDAVSLRRALLQRKEAEGVGALYEELTRVDPVYAAGVDPRNEKRVVRALEIWYATGEKPSVVRARAAAEESPYKSLYIGLFYKDRQKLYDRINLRVDRMLQNGLVEEARRFYASDASATAVQAIGYKELLPYLRGEIPLETAVESLKQATRRYAKRQITWFGRNEAVQRIYKDDLSDLDLLAAACGAVERSGIFQEDNE